MLLSAVKEAFKKSEIVILDGMMVLDRDLWTASLSNPLRLSFKGRLEGSIDPFLDGVLGIYEALSFTGDSYKNIKSIKM